MKIGLQFCWVDWHAPGERSEQRQGIAGQNFATDFAGSVADRSASPENFNRESKPLRPRIKEPDI